MYGAVIFENGLIYLLIYGFTIIDLFIESFGCLFFENALLNDGWLPFREPVRGTFPFPGTSPRSLSVSGDIVWSSLAVPNLLAEPVSRNIREPFRQLEPI